MRKIEILNSFIIPFIIGMPIVLSFFSCSSNVNTNNDPHFTDEGYLIKDSTELKFERRMPSSVKFYIEVSGSMNGFFRANMSTNFKTDVWKILTQFSPISPNVSILTNDGSQGLTLSHEDFRKSMNTGTFESSASTKVPLMLQTILNDLNTESDEVAVLISDMKYSPVGSAAPDVLLNQYSTDISNIIAKFGKSISVIGATSNYLNKSGESICDHSPYYYVILENPENVAEIRNYISMFLKLNDDFVDNIESGFNYGHAKYSFGIPNKCTQLGNEPTFLGYEEAEGGDTCTIKLKIPLEDYRWITANKEILSNSLEIKPLYGSDAKIGDIELEIKDSRGPDKQIERVASATVDIKIFNMPTDSEVIQWNLTLPVTNISLFNEFFIDANDENDPSKSFSVPDFLKGVFQLGAVIPDMEPNYILVSKKE